MKRLCLALQRACEAELTALVRDELRLQSQSQQQEQQQQQWAIEAVTVTLRRGHTCSNEWLLRFLEAFCHPDSPSANEAINNPGRASPAARQRWEDPVSAESAESAAAAAEARLPARMAALAARPETLQVVVEAGHGSRLLGSGEFRVDCRTTRERASQLLRESCVAALGAQARHGERTAALALLRGRLIEVS